MGAGQGRKGVNVLFVAAECAPFAKIGGLADVIGALPHALGEAGHAVRVTLPHHGVVDDSAFAIKPFATFEMPWGGEIARVEVAHTEHEGVTCYFLRSFPFFSGHERFVYHEDEGIDVGRFLWFSAAVLRWARLLAEQEGWRPDLFHVHDWHTALVPYLLHRVHSDDALLATAATLLTIHNMRYQGWGIGWHLERAGLPPVDHPLLASAGRTDNCLAIGLAYSTMLSTVSPRYAEEILTAEGGFGLDGLLHARSARLVGILNGIDAQRWNPATSLHIPQRFDVASLEKRVQNKLALQAELGLPQRADVPLVGAVMRLVEQKGVDILIPALRHLLSHAEMQFVLLGAGQYHYERDAWWLGHDFPDKAAVRLVFDEPLAERIYAGSDLFLMPSLFEPCGIGQMIAMRYGALPVVREVGGLADTVTPDVGFLFRPYEAGALQEAVSRALDVYFNRPAEWRERQWRAMQRDFSWQASAGQYAQLYEQAVALHHRYRRE